MDREQLIERVVAVMLTHYIEEDRTPREWDYLLAKDVLDAILPQITTIEELEALSHDAKVLGVNGSAWEYEPYASPCQWFGTNGDEWSNSDLLENFGPLTVVWRP